MKISAVLGLLGALAIGGTLTTATAPAVAGEALPAAVARQLDQQPIEFTASEAKMRRMMIIQQNMQRQRRYEARGGYGRGYGRGPGYGRPAYGPRPGYGHRRGYYGGPRY